MGKPLKENMTDKTTDTETNDDVSGLKANNADLKSRLDKATKSARDLEARLTAIEQEKTDEADTTKTEHEKALTKLQRALDKATADIASRDTRLGELLIDNAIKEAITTNKVAPQYAKAVEAMLRAGAKIENGEALAADGTPLSEANDAFFKSAEAQHFVSAPANAGAGATGSTARIGAIQKLPETADEWSAYMKLANENPAEASALADKWGRPDMKP